MTPEEREALKQHSDCIHTPEAVQIAITQVAEKITKNLSKANPIILSVANGGTFFSVDLFRKLDFPKEFDTVKLGSYQHNQPTEHLEWQLRPNPEKLAGRVVIICDDILDRGLTLAAVVAACQQAGAEAVYTAVLLDKHEKRVAGGHPQADFTGKTIDDRYVWGEGLDFDGQGREERGIWALKLAHLPHYTRPHESHPHDLPKQPRRSQRIGTSSTDYLGSGMFQSKKQRSLEEKDESSTNLRKAQKTQ